MEFCDFPIIRGEKDLPLFLGNMGQWVRQDHMIRPEGLSVPQILYCTRGSGTLVLDGTRVEIPPCTGVFLPADIPHEYYPQRQHVGYPLGGSGRLRRGEYPAAVRA